MSEPVVTVASAALQRAFQRSGYSQLWMQFQPRDPGAADAGAVTNAVADVVYEINEAFETGPYAEDSIWVDVTGWIPGGPGLFTKRMSTPQALTAWTEEFTARLSARGVSAPWWSRLVLQP